MIVVGLLGGSGTGKTTIAQCLAERLSSYGVGHVDADSIAHDLLAGDRGVRRRIRERFGDRIMAGGAIDRKKLGAVVFGDDEALRDLNAIIHPAVVAACRERIGAFEKDGMGVVVVDAALLLEVPDSPIALGIDHTIALRSTRAEQLRRLLAKGGATEGEISARLDSQTRLEKSFYKADDVVDTNRPLPEVVDEIVSIVEGLLSADSRDNAGKEV
jgi:dephospho-CoA kinase